MATSSGTVPSQTAERIGVNYSAEVPEHLPRTNDHEVAQAENIDDLENDENN